MAVPLPPLNLSSNPMSSASSYAGADMFGDSPGGYTGAVHFGPEGAAGGASWVSGLVRDLAMGVAVALLAKWLWNKL